MSSNPNNRRIRTSIDTNGRNPVEFDHTQVTKPEARQWLTEQRRMKRIRALVSIHARQREADAALKLQREGFYQ